MTTAVTIAPAPILQFFNNLGAPNVGGSILTQVGGLNYATYQDSAGTVPLPNPIPLNSRGEISNAAGLSTQLFLATNIVYVFTMFDVNGNQLNQATYVANADLTGIAGAGLVGYAASLAYAAATVGRKLQQIISPRDAPWNAVGDGVTDDTAALSAFFSASAGFDCNLEGRTYIISTGMVAQSNATYRNGKLKAKNAAALSSVLTGTAVTHTITDNLEIDGNADNTGSTQYGIFFTGGSSNVVRTCYAHDTKNAGARIDTEDGAMVLTSRFINCGRIGVTDNHGIMIGSSTGACKNWLLLGNYVKNAYRKGITTYGFGLGTCLNGRIVGNHVEGCNLGGIYIAGDVGTVTGAINITLDNNVAFDNYVNYDIANCSFITGAGNDSHYTSAAPVTITFTVAPSSGATSGTLTMNWTGTTGVWNVNFVETVGGALESRSVTLTNGATSATWATSLTANCNAASAGLYAGWAFEGVQNVNITGGINDGAPVHGVVLNMANAVSCLNVSVRGMTITRPNQVNAATGAGVQITDSTFCTIEADISDTSGKMTHGILEGSGGDNNDIGGSVRNGTAARIAIAGVNTRMRNRAGRNTGFNTADPLNTIDVMGGLTIRPQSLVLANGANQNVVLPANAGALISFTPSGAYSIGGIVGWHDGRRLSITNYTGFAMTLNHQDVGSTAANRFTLAGNAARIIPTLGGIEIMYSSTVGSWIALS